MMRSVVALLCAASLALLPVASADPGPDLGDPCVKVPCPYLHLFSVCEGDLSNLIPPSVVLSNDTSDCR